MIPYLRRAIAPSLLLSSFFLAACGGDKSPTTPPPNCSINSVASPSLASVRPLQPGPYHALFVAAAEEFGVPANVLESIGWTETRWTMVRGQQEFEGMPAAFGIMALRGAALQRGAALAGVTEEAVRSDPRANIRAAAALLAAYGSETGADTASAASWAEATARFSGITLPAGRDQYAARVLAGAGVAQIRPLADAVADNGCVTPPADQADESGAIWRPSPNFGMDRRLTGEQKVQMVIIHTCEGNYSGCWSWLVNTAAQASAHYVVNENGSEISNLVHEKYRAWHIAANYDCTLNYGFECPQGMYNGVSVNNFSIGIEHAGFADTTPWATSMIDASAQLVCDISKRWSIPLDWRHIVGHGQLQPANRHDPGPNWPWTYYMGKIQRDCGELVVDDDNARNDTSFARVQASATWSSATDTTGFYAFGYHRADSGATDDPMIFSFYLAQAGTKTVEAWWKAGQDRSPQARYIAVSAAGDTLGSATVDQRSNGASWQQLGQWSFPAGWNRVVLSRIGPAGTVVVGDAVRVR